MPKTSNNHGGKRAGAGQPAPDPCMRAVPYATRLPRYLVDWLRQQPQPQTDVLRRALEREYHDQ